MVTEKILSEKISEREILPDILRGFAIILVVLGHCIQEGSGEAYRTESAYFSDRLYQFIYSFHMPLFMLISGYLGWHSINKCGKKQERRNLLGRRAVTLLIPIFLWTALDYVRILIVNYANGRPQPEALVFVYFYNALNNFWFLWAVWWCFLGIYVMHYHLKDNIIIYILVFLALFILPDGLGLGAYKYMLPYYLAGYYVHGYMHHKGHVFEKSPAIWKIVVSGLVFAGLFVYYNEDILIYLTGYKLVGKNIARQLYIDIYRLLIGFAGSCFFIFAWQYIIGCVGEINRAGKIKTEFRILRRLGSDSMGIYIISSYIIIFMIQRIGFINKPSYIFNIIETIVVLAVSLWMTIFIGKIPVLKKLIGK